MVMLRLSSAADHVRVMPMYNAQEGKLVMNVVCVTLIHVYTVSCKLHLTV